MPFFKFKLFGVIASDLESMLFGDEGLITLKQVEENLKEANGQDIEVDASSVGGATDPGVDIYFAFRDYKRQYPNAQMILNIKSQCASMFSHIASGEFWDIVTVEDISSYMMHNPSNYAQGDYRVMEANTDYLKRLSNLFADSYARRSRKTIEKIRTMMDKINGTWLFGQEIVDLGFADIVLPTTEQKNKDSMFATMQLKYDSMVNKLKQVTFEDDYLTRAVAKLENTVMTVGTYDSGIKIIDQEWSQSAADKRWRAHTGAEESPNSRYAKAFLWYDGDNPDLYGSYKLQVKDYTGGSEVVNIRAVNNASARLNQTQGPTSQEKTRIQGIIDKYQARWKKQQGTNSTQPASGGENITQEEVSMDFNEVKTTFSSELANLEQAGIDKGKADMIANNKAIMAIKNGDEYKNLSFVQERCDKAIEDGEPVAKLEMAIMALLRDPKNQATIESPGDINSGIKTTISGESSSEFEDEGL